MPINYIKKLFIPEFMLVDMILVHFFHAIFFCQFSKSLLGGKVQYKRSRTN